MIGSTEMISDTLDEYEQQDFAAQCQALEQDRARELAYLDERDALVSPRLRGLIADMQLRIALAVRLRQPHRLREWR